MMQSYLDWHRLEWKTFIHVFRFNIWHCFFGHLSRCFICSLCILYLNPNNTQTNWDPNNYTHARVHTHRVFRHTFKFTGILMGNDQAGSGSVMLRNWPKLHFLPCILRIGPAAFNGSSERPDVWACQTYVWSCKSFSLYRLFLMRGSADLGMPCQTICSVILIWTVWRL